MSTSCSAAGEAVERPVRPFPYSETSLEAQGKPGGANWQSDLARESAARAGGKAEGEAQARIAFDAQIEGLRQQMARALADFTQERAHYYAQVEAEVVQLALSIARRILHREAQVEPLVLASIVRVALDKIERGTEVKVRVHAQVAGEWRAYFLQNMDPISVPEVVEDATLEAGRCVVETALGTTELGLELQLREVEQGLADLLAQRPQAGA